ncbi:membrane protein insertase YidC [Devosia sp. 63-57]|uniref:membrane protein insertase YidC n=1 Tax=Devosia sp. 63-57 TaxID=1895751 RepID=UPI00086ACE0C|nr:membrane protein insertase YidC [Devosia sp. 63-57]ODT48780.1 MAG: membrane protein insertase YidC [Pelagibacterium sp. SCN 63-126]ODU81930.1 MAG: membrane protein insertase YidC [Pelagibacterium sp. SCN 63-17]OJX44292.1 MAG: membrane protein insertase YidC [Devosia sp. 63-57]
MNSDNRNVILAIVLSMAVLFGWQFFIAGPQLERAQQQAQQVAAQQQAEAQANLAVPQTGTDGATSATPAENTANQTFADRASAIAASQRVEISTLDLEGSINLTGARIDDLELKQYRETVDPNSPIITLLSPSGAPNGYYIEQGWAPAAGTTIAVPDGQSVWTLEGDNTTLTATTPVTLRFDNGQGLVFRRTFSLDDYYLFTVTQSVENAGSGDVALFPYSRVVRQGTPKVQNFFIQHEGLLGVLGSNNWVARKYHDIQNDKQVDFASTTGWLGIADKYWATAVLPKPGTNINARFTYAMSGTTPVYQSNYVETQPVVVPAGGSVTHESYVFAGAKEESVINSYEREYGFDRLELLIDWGWFHFITKPMHWLLVTLYGLLGNFGLAILAVTVIVKALFFPLANRSYASMAAMRRVQPEMKAIQERLKDDRTAQQQAMMELYKKEKINPLSGCWPVLIQIPVFFALYTVIFISLEMRHAPFFGWIQDLAAPDPTNIFTLFGLIPWNPMAVPFIGSFLHLGIWPVIMGITMWVQMKLNPPPPDPTQAMIFNWMPIIFTFMLGAFPAGLVIYWAWNNLLSITQQWVIMKRHGVEVNLLGNIADSFRRKPKPAEDAKS